MDDVSLRGAVGRGVGTALRLARGSVLGVSWAFVLLGVLSADVGGSPRTVAPGAATAPTASAAVRALVVATALHVAVYVWNDLVDLPLDRTEPRRASSPLVLGTVTPRAALAVSLVAAGATLLVAAPRPEAVVAAAAALALLGAYDVWGKRAAIPPVTDAVQGAGWACLVWCGASLAGSATPVTGWVALAVALAVVLINGVVGAGRDLANDERHGARTTAIVLGATAAGGRVRVPRALVAYGVVLHLAVVGAVLGALVAGGRTSPVRVLVVVVAGGLALAALVLALVRPHAVTVSWAAGLAHILVLELLPFAAVPVGAPAAVLLVVLGVAPWAGSGWVRDRLRALAGGARGGARAAPGPAPAVPAVGSSGAPA
ncbi:UbiA family prenyltransferase [Actinotalea solisilvae]|uniref:UbiA family prenyltransferase n=1 Tax=Actinotalea solisilvae TaxID=2072922 RepID=UPI0018F255DC|nr:UbiA family prenyltransferase [Actinotalea solisilvae]